MKTTEKQDRFLKFIDGFLQNNGYSPSVREIAQGLGLSSTSAVHSMIDRLQSKGLLHKEPGVARTLSVPMFANGHFGHTTTDLGIPILGRIRAGAPTLAEEHIEGYVPVQDFLKKYSNDFFLIVEGESMIDEGILPGDHALIRPQKSVNNGEIGAFRINGEVTLKIFHKDSDCVYLYPANDEYKPIKVHESDEFDTIGKYIMLLRVMER